MILPMVSSVTVTMVMYWILATGDHVLVREEGWVGEREGGREEGGREVGRRER